MGNVLNDPAFAAVTWIVIDFETLTPAGRPPEPVEVAAISGQFTPAGQWMETGRFHSLIRPPDDVPVTASDHEQTGLTARMLALERTADEVMTALDASVAAPPRRLVAHSAHTEATVIAGQHDHCPQLAKTSLLCTVKLARHAWPELNSHRLDAVLRFLRIAIPPDRHRAMPDAELTVQVFRHALAAGADRGLWTTLQEVETAAGIAPHPRRNRYPDAVQAPLF
jgi:DNA polymerase III epsilon subunit-like protein